MIWKNSWKNGARKVIFFVRNYYGKINLFYYLLGLGKNGGDGNELSAGMIILIVFLSLAFIGTIGFLAYKFYFKKII